MTPEEKQKKREHLLRLRQEAIDQDPFWFFEPSDGSITEEGKALLHKYLKEDDIPPKLDGQLDVLLCPAEIVGVGGGNQSGKSTLQILKGIIKSTGELPDALKPYEKHFERDIERAKKKFINGRVVAVNDFQLHNTVIKWWKYWIPRDYLLNGKWKDSWSAQYDTLTLYRNRVACAQVEFKTNKQDVDSFQGPPLDWLAYDEEPEQAIHKENLMRFTTADYLDIGFYWTPTKGMTWATDLFLNEDIDDERPLEFFQLSSVTNKKANLSTLDNILKEVNPTRDKNGPDYQTTKMKLLGEVVSLSGLVYGKLFNKALHVIEPFKIDNNAHIVYRGLDPHLVKPSVCVEVAVDRMENYYVIGTYAKDEETAQIKKDLKARVEANDYRLGQTRCDRSADSTIKVLGDRNVFRELSTGENAIPAMFKSEKFTGSIHAGIDTIKQLLKINEKTKKPRLFIFDIPENKLLINAFRTMERDTYSNEDDKGVKDRIKEGKHDAHAAMRYIFQSRVHWLPVSQGVPEFEVVNNNTGW
jgi:phage terminase large subunit-like protein